MAYVKILWNRNVVALEKYMFEGRDMDDPIEMHGCVEGMVSEQFIGTQVGNREIGRQLITDLYSLPGAGGSDERFMARDWFFREIGLFGKREDKFKTWTEMSMLEVQQITHLHQRLMHYIFLAENVQPQSAEKTFFERFKSLPEHLQIVASSSEFAGRDPKMDRQIEFLRNRKAAG
jgi:hypothetical protein